MIRALAHAPGAGGWSAKSNLTARLSKVASNVFIRHTSRNLGSLPNIIEHGDPIFILVMRLVRVYLIDDKDGVCCVEGGRGAARGQGYGILRRASP